MRRTLSLGAVAVVLAATTAADTVREIPIDRTAAQVERIRDLSFERPPTAVWASQQTASEGADSVSPIADVVPQLLGLPSDGTTLEEGVLASYDPVDGRI